MTPAKDTVKDTATKAVKKRLNGRNLALVLTLLSAAGL